MDTMMARWRILFLSVVLVVAVAVLLVNTGSWRPPVDSSKGAPSPAAAPTAATAPELWVATPTLTPAPSPALTPAREPEAAPTATPLPTPAPLPTLAPLPTPQLPIAALPVGRRFVGIYDFEGAGRGVPFDVEHMYVNWNDARALDSAITEARARGRVPLVSLEPWVSAGGRPEHVLAETVAGDNDGIVDTAARIVAAHAPQIVLVRFAHEMELIDAYPWAQRDGELYARAYRRVRDRFLAQGAANTRWVWSPAGNDNALGYYPGSDAVDYVGLTILGYEAWDRRFGLDHGRSFAELFGEKVARVTPLGKPVFVAELGVTTGDNADDPVRTAYQMAWLAAAAAAFDSYPQLVGVVYFDARNPPNAWMGDRPDWRIEPALLYTLLTTTSDSPRSRPGAHHSNPSTPGDWREPRGQ
jgi:beta-mannanase